MCDVAEKYDVIEGEFLQVIQGLEGGKKACTVSGAADGWFLPVLLESLQGCSVHRFPFTHILLLDLHELMSSILNNKKQNQSVSAAGVFLCFFYF